MSFASIIDDISKISLSVSWPDRLKLDFMSLLKSIFQSFRTSSRLFSSSLLFFWDIFDPLHLSRKIIYIDLRVLFEVLLFLSESAHRKLVIERFEFARFDSTALSFEERRHLNVFFRFVKLTLVVVLHLFLKSLFTHWECLLVQLVILLSLFKFEGRDADLQNRLTGWINLTLTFFLRCRAHATDKNWKL